MNSGRLIPIPPVGRDFGRALTSRSAGPEAALPAGSRSGSGSAGPRMLATSVEAPRCLAPARAPAFTLVELLVVTAIITILASLSLPALARAKERARVAKVHAELYGIGLALQMYGDDHAGRVPPVRVNCNSDLATHWCQLPVELAEQRYLPRNSQAGREADLEDPFARGHTYKYAAPGPQLLNGDPVGNYELWVPRDFPALDGDEGEGHRDPATSPVRWVVWSQGPRPDSAKTRSSHAPMSARTWYRHAGDDGVITRFAERDGMQRKSP